MESPDNQPFIKKFADHYARIKKLTIAFAAWVVLGAAILLWGAFHTIADPARDGAYFWSAFAIYAAGTVANLMLGMRWHRRYKKLCAEWDLYMAMQKGR